MGCNCRKAGSAKVFTYTSPTGQVVAYRTEIEAKAAVIRNGGGTYTAG